MQEKKIMKNILNKIIFQIKYNPKSIDDLNSYLSDIKEKTPRKKNQKCAIYTHLLVKNGPKELADFFANNLLEFDKSSSLLNIGIGFDIPPAWLTFFRNVLGYNKIASLEVWKPYIDHWQYNKKFPVWHGDVRDIAKILPPKSVDTILWAHGPEHVPIKDFLPIYNDLKKIAKHHIFFVTPWGGAYDYQEDINNNPFEIHKVKNPDERIYDGTNLNRIIWGKKGTLQAGMLAYEFIDNNKIKLNWHEDFIVQLASILRPKIYMELGLYQCVLFNRMIPFADMLIGVDCSSDAGKFMLKSEKTKFICQKTDEYIQHLKRKPVKINLLFIDANHTSESVLSDFKNYFPFVADQGIILLHDSYPKNKTQATPDYCGDGYKTIEKISKNNPDYEIVTLPIVPGLSICRKRKKHLNWSA